MDLLKTNFFIPIILLYFLALIFPSLYSYNFFHVSYFYLNVGSLFVPFIYFFGDIITELYGFRLFKKIVIYAALVSAIFTGLTYLLVIISNKLNPAMSIHYQKIFGHNNRIMIAVIFGITISSLLNGFILSKLRKLFKHKFFIPRSIASSITGEFLEAIFVGFIGYLFIIPVYNIFIMASSVMVYRTLANIPLSTIASVIIILVRKFDKLEKI